MRGDGNWTMPYRAACAALVASPGWSASHIGNLPCHGGSPALICQAAGADARLFVCLTCLQGYTESAGVFIGPGVAGNPHLCRICRGCNEQLPLSDFVSRTGSISVLCSVCRAAWGKQKRAEEEAELRVAMIGAANGLRRIQRDLAE